MEGGKCDVLVALRGCTIFLMILMFTKYEEDCVRTFVSLKLPPPKTQNTFFILSHSKYVFAMFEVHRTVLKQSIIKNEIHNFKGTIFSVNLI